MGYLENSWYMAAWSEEVLPQDTFARVLLDRPVLLFRDAAGQVQALDDRCPHRFAPLSTGKFVNGVVTCSYHGLAFDGSGACVANPHGAITNSLRVRNYPVVERDRIIWIWMGDAAMADAGTIPDLSILSATPDTAFSNGYLAGKGNYQLFVDNLIDLSHVDYLHATTFASGLMTSNRPNIVEHGDGRISLSWHSPDHAVAPFQRKFLPENVERAATWTEAVWTAPGIVTFSGDVAEVGMPRSEAKNFTQVHALTPESQFTTHYFFASTRNFALEDTVFNEQVRQMRQHVFETEDAPMIEAQQERIGLRDFWSMHPALLKSDEAAVRVRRRLDALIAQERSSIMPSEAVAAE